MTSQRRARELCVLLTISFAISGLAQETPPPQTRQEGVPPRPADEMRPAMDLPKSIEDMLGLAMRDSPQVRVAEAKLQEAEAELTQARQQAAREVTTMFHDRTLLQIRVDRLRAAVEGKQKDAPEADLTERQSQLRECEANLDAVNAQLRYLLGMFPRAESGGSRHVAPAPGGEPHPAMQPRPPVPARYQEAMEARITLSLSGVAMIREVVDQLAKAAALNFMCGVDNEILANVTLNDATVLDAMNILSEVSGSKLCFVFRDYGVLVTTPEEARMIPGPAVPSYTPYEGPPMPPQP